jgi:hypothetical protein
MLTLRQQLRSIAIEALRIEKERQIAAAARRVNDEEIARRAMAVQATKDADRDKKLIAAMQGKGALTIRELSSWAGVGRTVAKRRLTALTSRRIVTQTVCKTTEKWALAEGANAAAAKP